MTESVLINSAIDATEGQDVAVIDAPGAFLTADMDEEVMVVLENEMVDAMLEIDRKIYGKYASWECQKVKILPKGKMWEMRSHKKRILSLVKNRGLGSKKFTQTNGGFDSTRSEPAGLCWKSEN